MKCLSKKSEEITDTLLATKGEPTDLEDIIRSSTLGVILGKKKFYLSFKE